MKLLVTLLAVAGTGLASAAEASGWPGPVVRALGAETVAWWTFDNHLRDEVSGLTLDNVRNEREDLEEFYRSIQFVDDVPILRLGDRLNWRGYYRWGTPNLTRGEVGDALELQGAFTIEGYLNARSLRGRPPQHRAAILRKQRTGGEAAEPQWSIGLHRDGASGPHAADLWARVVFRLPDGRRVATEVSARDALPLAAWHHFAVIFDGADLSLRIDGKQVSRAAGPGAGACVLPSGGRSELLISALADELSADKPPEPEEERDWCMVYQGRIDELRISQVALAPDRLLPVPCGVVSDPLSDPPRRDEYTSLARRHLGLLMRHGTDTYGKVHSPLLGSTLDPDTKRMLALKPPRVPGMPFVGDSYRSPLHGCNLTLMRHTLAAMRALSAVTGDTRYAEHADKALRFWFENCLYPSGVWPLGEHGVWNFHTDTPQPKRPHEPQGLLDWPLYWKIAPEKVRRELELMHPSHVFEYEFEGSKLAFHGRHGSSEGKQHGVGGCGFARHSGLFARAWAFLYSKTKDPKHLRWARDQLELLWTLRDPATGLCPTQVFPPPGFTFGGRTYPAKRGAGTQPIWAAIGFLDAIAWLDDPADKQLLKERALALAMANFDVYYKWDGKQFSDTRLRWNSSTSSPGGAWLMLKVWERAGKPGRLLEQVRRVADARMGAWRPCKTTDAGRYGWNILLYVQLSNETSEDKYLDFARRLGDYAAANLITSDGLVVGSCHYRYYDRMYHIPKLVQGLLALDHPKHVAVQPFFRDPYF